MRVQRISFLGGSSAVFRRPECLSPLLPLDPDERRVAVLATTRPGERVNVRIGGCLGTWPA